MTENLTAPLSHCQRGLWLYDRTQAARTAYNLCWAWRLTGALNYKALEMAVNAIVERHHSLRTSFVEVGGEVRQTIAPSAPVDIPVIDISGQPDDAQEACVMETLRAEWHTPFDLSSGSLLRLRLLKLAHDEHVLFRSVHHIVFDGWSSGIFNRELSGLYNAYTSGYPANLSDLSAQYADFALQEQARSSSAPVIRALAYWNRQLASLPENPGLPSDAPRPAIETGDAELLELEFPPTLIDLARKFGRANGASLFMTLLAAFGVLIAKYSRKDDFAIGTPVANRRDPQFEPIIGLFAHLLPIRLRVTGGITFRGLLRQVSNTLLEAFDHQEISLARLMPELPAARRAGDAPLVRTMFALQDAPWAAASLSGVASTLVRRADQRKSPHDLEVHILPRNNATTIQWLYSSVLFSGARMQQMSRHFISAVDALLTRPDVPLRRMDLMTSEDRHRLLVESSGPATGDSHPACLHLVFEEQVVRSPDAVALISERESITADELNRRANRLAHRLIQMGVRPETLVGLCFERSIAVVTAIIAVLKAGAGYVLLDPAYPAERLKYMAADSGLSFVISAGGTEHTFAQESFLWEDVLAESNALPDTNPALNLHPDNLAHVFYTSGSTGLPKGTAGSHRGTLNRLVWLWETYPFHNGEVLCLKTSLNFIDSVCELFSPLLRGVPLVVLPRHEAAELPVLISCLEQHLVTRIVLTPSWLREVLNYLQNRASRLPAMEIITASGEELTPDLVRQTNDILPHVTVLNFYGSTEVSADALWADVTTISNRFRVPIGRPIANMHACVLDENLELVPVGVPGELYIGGPGLARGYWNRPDLTAERFIPDPFASAPGSRLYRAGDIAYWSEHGVLEFVGRSDNQVKVRGMRVELGEVEARLTQHPNIERAVVMAVATRPGDLTLKAWLVCRKSITGAELRGFAAVTLPEFMLPSAFIFCPEIPLTPSGKVDRRALSAMPEPLSTTAPRSYDPLTPTEAVLADIWKESLGLECVDVEDNFFELGGHSMIAVHMTSEIEKTLGVRVPARTMYFRPTIAALAQTLDEAMAAA